MSTDALAADREEIVARTAGLWDALRGERVFVTGGTGFVGTWLLEAFAAANRAYGLGAHAVVLSRDPARFRARSPHLAADPALSFVSGDATSFAAPAGTFRFVVHGATERRFEPDRERPLGLFLPDFVATTRVLDFAAAHGAQRLLLTSSGAVYGPAASALERVPETYPGAPDPTDPAGAYGESKRVSELAFAAYGRVHGFTATIGRLFAFVGPHLPLEEGYAVGNFLADALRGRPIDIAGDGTPRRSYLYAADMAVWLWTILLRGAPGRAYNVGSPAGLSIRELAETVVAAVAPGTPVTVARGAAPGAGARSYVPDTARAEHELGLRAWTPLSEALRRTYEFHRPTGRITAAP